MEGSVTDLSRYRLARAKEDLDTARKNYADGSQAREFTFTGA